MSQERREKQRFLVPQFVDISFMREDFINVEGIDISLKGLKVRADKILDPYTKVFTMIDINDGEPLSIEGLVVYIEPDEKILGIQFLDLSESIKTRLEKFLSSIV